MTTPTDCHKYVSLSNFDWSFNRTGPVPWSPGVYSIIAAFSALAIWSSFPLTIRLLFTFKSYRGLYFWSILITTWGLSIRELGFLLKYLVPTCPWIFSLTLAEIGWVCMVTGFSIVLWSRLHLIVHSRLVLRLVLAMIIVDGIILHSILITLQFGLASATKDHRRFWLAAINPTERIQVSWFTVQELIVSYFYIKAAYDYLQDHFKGDMSGRVRRVMILLVAVQFVVLALDIIIITIDCAGYFQLKATIHSFVYAIKLELEFVVLNQLVDIAKLGVPGLTTLADDLSGSGESRATSTAITHPPSSFSSNEKMDWSHALSMPPSPTSAPNPLCRPSYVHRAGSATLVQIPENKVPDVTTLTLDHIGVIPNV